MTGIEFVQKFPYIKKIEMNHFVNSKSELSYQKHFSIGITSEYIHICITYSNYSYYTYVRSSFDNQHPL